MEPAEDPLVSLGLDFATATVESVEVWLRQQQQQRTLQGLPSPLASALFRRLQLRRLLFPSLLEIFVECLEDVDLSGEVDVDSEWMAYLGGFRHLWSLNLADCQALTDSALRALSGMTTLKDLDLSRCYKISDAGIRHLLLNTSLEKLSVSGTKLTEDGIITCFKSFGYLRFLDLSRLRVTDRALSSLEVLKYLEHLNLQGSSVTNKGVVYLKSLSKLSSLDVSFTSVNGLPFLSSLIYLNMNDCLINKVFNEGGKCLAPLATLLLSRTIFKNESEAFSCIQPDLVTYLDLSKSYVSQFHFLADMRRLEHLNLGHSKLVDESIATIATMGANLKVLDLSHTKVTSTGISILASNVPKLQVLLLSYTKIDDSSLTYFGMMPSLKQINLDYSNVKGFTLKPNLERVYSLTALDKVKCLESLNLLGISLTDDTLYPLFQIQRLKYLYLRSEHLTNLSMHLMSKLTNIEFLGFCRSLLTNTGLISFQPPSTLKKIDLRGCWLLDKDAILSFSKLFPHIEVKHELLEPSASGSRRHNRTHR